MKLNDKLKIRKDKVGYICFCEGLEIVINKSGYEILRLLKNKNNLNDIFEYFNKKYKINKKRFKKEIKDFLNLMISKNIIIKE